MCRDSSSAAKCIQPVESERVRNSPAAGINHGSSNLHGKVVTALQCCQPRDARIGNHQA